MGRVASIPPLNMTPELLAKALLRPVNQDQEKSEASGRQGKDKEVIALFPISAVKCPLA